MPAHVLTSENLHDPIRPYINPQVVALRADQTVAEARRSLPPATTDRIAYYYVVDADGRLQGVVGARHLLVSGDDTRVGDIASRDVVAIPAWATVLVACEYFTSRRLLAFPVVEDDGRLAGVVDIGLFTDEMLRISRQSFDDIFQLIGVHATHSRSPLRGFRDRFPWLLTNVAGGIVAALLVARFEVLLERAIVLALFIPVVLALAESVSIQSVTLTIQGLHAGRLNWRLFARGLRKEALTSLLLGAACGTLVATIAWLWRGEPDVGAIIGAAIVLSMLAAAVFGLVVPTALHALRANPRIAAGPIVLASADMATLALYFGIAGFLLS